MSAKFAFVVGPFPSMEPLTTAEAARILERTPWTVRWLAREGRLPYLLRTQSGQRLFGKGAVQRLAYERGEQRLRGVRVLRPKKRGVPGQPLQLSMFAAGVRPQMATVTRLRLVAHTSTEALIQRA